MTDTIIRKTLKMDLFIVPNQAGYVSDFWIGSEKQSKIASMICDLNGYSFNPEEDKVVQVWSCCEDCDNMQDHYFKAFGENGIEYSFRFPSSYIPAKVLKHHKEGETFELVYQMKPVDNHEENKKFEFIFKVTLSQSKYRYRRFGNFEDALNYVL